MWRDAEDIGIALSEKFPDVDPLTVRFTDLHRWVTELPSSPTTPRPPTSRPSKRSRWRGSMSTGTDSQLERGFAPFRVVARQASAHRRSTTVEARSPSEVYQVMTWSASKMRSSSASYDSSSGTRGTVTPAGSVTAAAPGSSATSVTSSPAPCCWAMTVEQRARVVALEQVEDAGHQKTRKRRPCADELGDLLARDARSTGWPSAFQSGSAGTALAPRRGTGCRAA